MLSAATIKSVFRPILEDIRIHRDRNLSKSIPIDLYVQEHYRCSRSFRKSAENQVLDNGVKKNVINFFHWWSEYKVGKGKQPGFNMLDHYASGANTRYLQLSFVKSL